jgi:hypothetical protein
LPHGGGIKIKAVAAQHNFDISGFEIVDALHSEAGLYLARQDKRRTNFRSDSIERDRWQHDRKSR